MKLFAKIKKIFMFKTKKNKQITKHKKTNKNNDETNQSIYKMVGDENLENTQEVLNKISKAIPEDNTLYKLSKFFSNFSDNTRLKIISCLSFGELCVTDISKALNMNQTTISHQLAYLKASGTVTTRRDGKIIYYSLATTEIQDCLTYGANFIAL